jgi:hypothetical protein
MRHLEVLWCCGYLAPGICSGLSVSVYIVNDYIKNENKSVMFSSVYVGMLCTFYFEKLLLCALYLFCLIA